MSRSQFQPYLTGWETSPARLALNTTAVTTAMTAAVAPRRADRTGTDRTPVPGSSALRVPTTAADGRPTAAAILATTDGRAATSAAPLRAALTAKVASSPSSTTARTAPPAPEHQSVGMDPAARIVTADRSDR